MKITTSKNVTTEQISALGAEAARAGDLLQHAVCELAKGDENYSDAAWLNDNTCLDVHERRKLESMTVEIALAECVRVINDAEAQS